MLHLHIGHEHLPRAQGLGDFLAAWDPDLYTLIPLAVLVGLYLLGRWRLERRAKYPAGRGLGDLFYLGGALALFAALASPIDVYAGDLFFMHMVQHLLLVMVAAPLLMLANPLSRALWAFPQGVRRRLGGALHRSGPLRWVLRWVTAPVAAWLVFAITLWVWHTPAPYDAALGSEALHAFEHLTMFGAAVIFWWPVIGPAPMRSHLPHPLRFLYLFLALFQNIILGAILTFADGPVYSHYQGVPAHWGIGSDSDQQLGGVLMWIPGTMMYFTALAVLFFAWLDQEDRRASQRRRAEEARRRYAAETAT